MAARSYRRLKRYSNLARERGTCLSRMGREVPVMGLLMLPRVVLTHLKAGFRAALRPDPVMIGWWTQPALPTPVKQCRPSLTTVLAGWKLRCAKVAISARRKPFTRRNFKRIGFPSGVVSTAATIGVLPGEPRPPLAAVALPA